MITEDNIVQIETGLGLKEGTLKDAIASEEAVTVEMPVGKMYDPEKFEIRTKEDHETLIGNIKSENKIAGLEIAIKEKRSDLKYEFEGKTLDNLLSAHATKVLADAKIEPDAKNLELTNDNKQLNKTNLEIQKKLDDLVLSTDQKDSRRKTEGNIMTHISDDLTLNRSQILTLFLAEHEVVEEDGKQLVKKAGQTLKDDGTREPLQLKDIVATFTEAFKKPVEGGGDGDDTTGDGKAGSIEAFTKEMEKKGVAVGSVAFSEEMNKRIGDKTLTI